MIGDRCPRCGARLDPSTEIVLCERCAAMVDAMPAGGFNRRTKRLTLVGVVVLALIGWAAIVPVSDWNSTSLVVFGTVSVFMLSMAWVVSGSIIDA